MAAAEAGLAAVSADLETVALKAMEKQSVDRYASAAELADELQRVSDGVPVLARPIGPLERARRKLAKNRVLWTGALAAATILIVLAGAFGTTLSYTIAQSSASLQALDRAQASSQAGTLERSIRVNMLQGRADMARQLVRELAAQEGVGDVRVFRTDRTPAYLDSRTRRRVEQYIARDDVIERTRERFPELLPQLQVLKTVAFPNIDAQKQESAPNATAPHDVWIRAIHAGELAWYVEGSSTDGTLVVLKPIKNTEQCQACHGEHDDYVDNEVRAVLMVTRPLEPIGRLVESNRQTVMAVGLVTLLVFLLLAIIMGRVFGIGLARREFGQ